jgi:hypothetical protein
MFPAVALAVSAGLLARSWCRRTPFDISPRLPRRLSARARVQWRERVFLGWTEGWFSGPRFAFGMPEDSVGIVGPPRVNKTAGIGTPQVLMWGGPLISVAPKPQMFRDAAAKRRELAKIQGGRVLMYAPTVSGRVEGLVPVRFSPAGSMDPTEITLRVDSWTEAAGTGKNDGAPGGCAGRSAGRFGRCGAGLAASYEPAHGGRPGAAGGVDQGMSREALIHYQLRVLAREGASYQALPADRERAAGRSQRLQLSPDVDGSTPSCKMPDGLLP